MLVFEGNAYRHKKTNRVYTVMAIALNEADLKPVVVYQRNGGETETDVGGVRQVWARPSAEFCDGRFEAVE